MNLSWQAVVEKTVTGLGYEVVGCERSAGGLLRVFIDKPLVDGQEPETPVNVEDCERVTRQLRYVMEVEEVDYTRLEVSTPGLDRPLNNAGDYARFSGHEVEITLREAFQGRKKYRGVLVASEGVAQDDWNALAQNTAWRVIFMDGKTEQVLDFALDEVRSAKLVPEIVFKGRTQKSAGDAAADAAAKKNTGLAPGSESADGAAAKPKASKKKSNAKSRQTDDKVDGGLDQ